MPDGLEGKALELFRGRRLKRELKDLEDRLRLLEREVEECDRAVAAIREYAHQAARDALKLD